MSDDMTRRGLLGALAAGGAAEGTLAPVRGYLRDFAPFTGSTWAAADAGERALDSPHGAATVRYDDYGVPHVEGESEAALFYAVGYAQAADRLFQLDLQRRVMSGRLSEVVGAGTLGSDEFHRRMGFTEAAEATWAATAGTPAGDAVEAFAAGVNAFISDGPLPPEFGLLDYEPSEWTPADTMLMEKQIAWTLTGSFHSLRMARLRRELDADVVEALYPSRLDGVTPIIRDGAREDAALADRRPPDAAVPDGALVEWLSEFESPADIGSNSWGVRGDANATGRGALVANDPHLSLMAPPVWYEQHLAGAGLNVRGVTFPGVPFVVIGRNDRGAWSFTNVGADVLDCYTYETREGEYRYRGEWRAFDAATETIPVAGEEDRTMTRRETVHGPVLEREGAEVGVAWTGLAATRTTEAIYAFNESEGVDDVREATRKFDEPTQNLVYGDADGHLLYYATGAIPIRRTDGDVVRGDRVFDGSAGEGEWRGFTPYGTADWEGDGFVPFDEKPHLDDPAYVGTANQRVTDDTEHYLAAAYSDPYRGNRVYDLLDSRLAGGETVERAFVRGMQADTHDGRSDVLPRFLDAAGGMADYAEDLSRLAGWDGRMDRESRAALVFAFWFDAYREAVADRVLADTDIDASDESYWPRDWVVHHLTPDSPVLDGVDDYAALVQDALQTAEERIAAAGYETYGDYNTTGVITHPFDQGFLNYPEHPTDGSRATLNNYARERADTGSPTGSSWRMAVDAGGDAECIVPGGNSGIFLSPHYRDQLRAWADTTYKDYALAVDGDVRFTFTEAER